MNTNVFTLWFLSARPTREKLKSCIFLEHFPRQPSVEANYIHSIHFFFSYPMMNFFLQREKWFLKALNNMLIFLLIAPGWITPEFEAFTDEMILDVNHCCMEIFLAPGEKIKEGVHNTAAVWPESSIFLRTNLNYTCFMLTDFSPERPLLDNRRMCTTGKNENLQYYYNEKDWVWVTFCLVGWQSQLEALVWDLVLVQNDRSWYLILVSEILFCL